MLHDNTTPDAHDARAHAPTSPTMAWVLFTLMFLLLFLLITLIA